MKNIFFVLLLSVIACIPIQAQENPKVTEKLKKEYSFVKYDESYGGWYCVSDKVSNKIGVCDKKGKLIIPCKYDWVGFKGDSYQMFNEIQNISRWGACDIKGKEIVPPIYNSCNNVIEMLRMGGYDGPPKDGNYYHIEDDSGKEGLIDVNGKVIFECKYERIDWKNLWEYGFCKVRLNDKYGFYDKSGKQILPHLYDDIEVTVSDKTKNVRLIVRKDRSYGLFDIKGKELAAIEYDYIASIHEGLLVCEKGAHKEHNNYKYGLYGYLDEDGNLVIPCKYEDASSFKDGVAQVVENGVQSLLTNPLTGTTLNKLNGGDDSNIKVDKNIPITGKDNQEMFAFIFACENYVHLSGADYSINDGKVLKDYCAKTLGLPEKSIRYLEDATFGNMNGAIQKLKDIADVFDGDAKILFYFSGLGATDPTTKEAYLLPTDASIQTLTTTGYSVSKLIQELNALNTQGTIVILDAPFSGTDKTGKLLAEHRGVALKCKSPTPQNKVVLCTSSSNGENSFSNKKYGHSLFTYALLDKLQQSKGACSIKEWLEDAIVWVKKQSLSEFDKIQTPQIFKSEQVDIIFQNFNF